MNAMKIAEPMRRMALPPEMPFEENGLENIAGFDNAAFTL